MVDEFAGITWHETDTDYGGGDAGWLLCGPQRVIFIVNRRTRLGGALLLDAAALLKGRRAATGTHYGFSLSRGELQTIRPTSLGEVLELKTTGGLFRISVATLSRQPLLDSLARHGYPVE